jgi:predicted GNAT family N-acyltransferase
MNIKLIPYGSAQYEAEIKLRDETLRKPLGLSLYDEDLSHEINDFHIGAFNKDELVGIVILTKLNETVIKMRQLGIAESMRGKNIGKELVKYSEQFAIKQGYKKIELNARETVVDFYLKLGYEKIGERFTEVTIPHFKMIKYI